jgi:adenosyl cobinamide kinase/adenosyl cobinamide phosphate guanylyltransferase
MTKLSQLAQAKTHRVCIFGPPKSGKTELAGKLAEHFNLLWFDLENGWDTLLKLPAEWQDRIELIRIPDTKTYPIAIETMLKVIKGSPLEICEQHGKVSCPLCKKDSGPFNRVALSEVGDNTIVVFDSGTQLANSAMNHITKNQDELYKAEWSDYRSQGQLMEKFLSELQQAKYNCVFITHEAEVEMEDGRKKIVPVSGTTNFSRNTAKYFDDVVYCEVKNKKHNFASATTYANSILTGSRTDVRMEDDETPTLLRVFKPELYPTKVTPHKPSPAQNAVKNLSALAALQGVKK